ncbi:hypothetical protein Tco_1458340 [Tanacetum coccineum]
MHNNIMADGSRDYPPMLVTGRYARWQSCFMRYVDTKPNGEALNKCILNGPYKFSNIIIPGQPATDESLEVPERTTLETFSNLSPKNKAHYEAEKEEIHLILIGIGDDIYSTVDACNTAHDMWVLQNDELNGKKPVGSCYYYQKEVNEIHAKKIARNANPIALVVSAQQYPDPYYQAPKSHKSCASPSKQSPSTRSHVPTRHKVKEIAKPITPPSESASEEESDLEQA